MRVRSRLSSQIAPSGGSADVSACGSCGAEDNGAEAAGSSGTDAATQATRYRRIIAV
jgi:hypothetical protein